VKNAVGVEALSDAPELAYLAYDSDKLEKLYEYPELLRTPIVRNGKQATVGYCPDVWKTWE
jgi:arsenate reductase-like glutaredoxin family protein